MDPRPNGHDDAFPGGHPLLQVPRGRSGKGFLTRGGWGFRSDARTQLPPSGQTDHSLLS